MFANMTWLLVGSSAKEFFTLEEAWRSVLRISLGEAENFYPQILAAQPTVGPVVIVLYQVLGIVLLLNVVIAIILEVWLNLLRFLRKEGWRGGTGEMIINKYESVVVLKRCKMTEKSSWR